MTFALQESYASSVPLRPKWEQLDSSLLPPGEENWQQHIWLFHRGVGSEKQKQYFPLQKLDMLIVSFASLVFRRAPAAPASWAWTAAATWTDRGSATCRRTTRSSER